MDILHIHFCTFQIPMYMYMYMIHAIWEFAQSAYCVAQTEDPQNVCQSADCAILIVQTVEPQATTNLSITDSNT